MDSKVPQIMMAMETKCAGTLMTGIAMLIYALTSYLAAEVEVLRIKFMPS
ncbi:MAG: hypothetical protein WKF84_13695 [Pyrinomonadaceae bacterium]